VVTCSPLCADRRGAVAVGDVASWGGGRTLVTAARQLVVPPAALLP
jgi:hypothetical protein